MKKLFTLVALLGLAIGTNASVSWWKVGSTTSTSADATYLDDAILNVKTVFAGTCNSTYAHNYTDGNSFSHNINIRVDAAPSVGTPTGTEKSGNTPLIITPKKNCTITFYYRRQANSSTFVSNDGKDMKLVDQADPTTLLVATSFLKDGTATEYDWCIKSYSLEKGKIYTLWAKGTTVSLNGFSYEVPGTSAEKNAEKLNQHAYLDNAGTINDGDIDVISFESYPMTIEGTNIQAGNAQYQFTVSGNNYTGVKFAASQTYVVKPATGVTITDVKAYGSSNSSTAAGIESGANSISLAARGEKNTPVSMTPLTLTKNGEGFYFFTITGAQSIIVLDVTYDMVENIDVTVSDAGYATLFYDNKVSIPTGVKAYTAELNGSSITLNEVVGVIPANTGVILEAAPGKYNFPVTTDAAPVIGTNILLGTTTETTASAIGGSVYTLGKNGEGVVGLRNYTGTDIRAYCAYAKDLGVAAPFLSFDFGNETTNIADVINKMKDARGDFFDLQGRKVDQPTKGLYIVNGKKVVIK